MFKPRQMVMVIKVESDWPSAGWTPPVVGMKGMVVKTSQGVEYECDPKTGRVPVRFKSSDLGLTNYDGCHAFVIYNLKTTDIAPV